MTIALSVAGGFVGGVAFAVLVAWGLSYAFDQING